MWFPIHAIKLNLLQVRGRSDLFLRLEIIKKIINVIVLCISLPFGLVWMCVASIFNSIIALVINTFYTGKLINVGFWTQMRDIFPILVLSLVAGGASWLSVSFVSFHPAIALIVGAAVAAIVYFGGSKIFKFNEMTELIEMVRNRKTQK